MRSVPATRAASMGPGYVPGPVDASGAGRTSHALPFRPDIEGLRGIAVLLVVAYHVGLPVGGGFVGVDVFFVLSGYLIVGLLRHEAAESGTISLAAFYARRIRRLLPAATVVLIGTILLASLLYAPLEAAAAARTARAAAMYVSNLRFWRASTDYFNEETAADPFLHTWSLSVEEQFYLVCPVLVLYLARRRAFVRPLAWTLGLILAASWAGYSWYIFAHQPTAFYQSPLRAWEFAAGALLAIAPASGAPAPASPRDAVALRVAGWLGLALVVGAALGAMASATSPGAAVFVPVGGTVLLLAAGAQVAPWSVGRLLSAPPLQWIGRRSYSWYLWHWPILVLGAVAVGDVGTIGRTGLALGALGLAAATYALVEQPCRQPRGAWGRPWPVIGAGLLLTLGSAGVAEGARRRALALAESPAHRAVAAAAEDSPRPYHDGCNSTWLKDEVRACAYGATHEQRTVVLFGDSHAGHWFPALLGVAEERGWRLVVMIKSACPAADVTIHSSRLGRRYVECERWRDAAMDSLRRWRPALVVISSSSGYVTARPAGEPARRSGERHVDAEAWRAGMARTLRDLHAAGIPVAVIRDTPRPGFVVPACLSRPLPFPWQRNACAVAKDEAFNEDVVLAERAVVAALPGTRYLDLTDRFCDESTCPGTIDGVIAYKDSHHITAALSARLAPALRAALDGGGVPLALR